MLNDPNVVGMREVYTTSQQVHIIMNHVPDGELHEYLKNYEMAESEIALIMHQILRALHYLGRMGVVHRDLKPENILVEKDPRMQDIKQIFVTDFGLSKVLRPRELIMQQVGTPAYVAPEVLSSKGYGLEVDMWSAGVIFYQLICRSTPFSHRNQMFVLDMIREQQPDMSHDNFEKFSKEAQDLAMRMLNKNPAYRITPAQALQHPFFKVNKISVPWHPPTLHELVSMQKIRRAAAIVKAKERMPG